MEVILREDVEKLGSRGQVVKVAPGYARNFLIPKRLAVMATDSNKKIVEQERQAALRREAKEASEASELAKLLAGVSLTIAQKAGEEAVELVIEAVRQKRDRIIAESADLMYHVLVLWADAGVQPGEVWAELSRREGMSGIAEKAARPQG